MEEGKKKEEKPARNNALIISRERVRKEGGKNRDWERRRWVNGAEIILKPQSSKMLPSSPERPGQHAHAAVPNTEVLLFFFF